MGQGDVRSLTLFVTMSVFPHRFVGGEISPGRFAVRSVALDLRPWTKANRLAAPLSAFCLVGNTSVPPRRFDSPACNIPPYVSASFAITPRGAGGSRTDTEKKKMEQVELTGFFTNGVFSRGNQECFMLRRLAVSFLIASIAGCWLSPVASAQQEDWEADIRQFESADRANPPAKGCHLFVGSSTIRLWDLAKSFPEQATINRGFGGSQMRDVLQYKDRIVFAYQPSTIVLYEGDNDIHHGASPTQVVKEVKTFAAEVRKRLPDSKLIVLGIKPSLARWQLWPQMKQANDELAAYCATTPGCHFVDVSRVMLDNAGQPLAALFDEDGLHLNAQGYERWSALVRPLIEASE